jgi:hypothetical protein
MSEQTFRSPGFFEQEIELTAPGAAPTGVPGGIIGAAASGPAFVPTTVASFSDFEARFGGLDPDRPATYAANEWLKHKGALTFIRVLGAGANATSGDVAATVSTGAVRNAGFKLSGQAVSLPDDSTSDFATASITGLDVATLVNGEYFIIVDGSGTVLKVTFSSSATPGSPTITDAAGTVASPHLASVSIDTGGGATTTTVRDDLIAAINSAIYVPNPSITAAAGGAAAVTLTQGVPGTVGNTTITTTVTAGATVPAAFTGGDEAGFDGRKTNTMQFLVARHKLPADTVTPSEWRGFPLFSDNPSFNPSTSGDTVNIVRGVLMFPTGARGMVLDMTGSSSQWSGTGAFIDDVASTDLTSTSSTYKKFKLAISSSIGSSFGVTDGYAGLRILTASLDPSSTDYLGKVLNTDPKKFNDEQHLLYLDLPVEDEIAPLDTTGDSCIAIASGSNSTYLGNFGRFDTRYTTARTPAFISQPFGNLEHDLFHFETITDGASGNSLFKISIANVKASTDSKNPYGTFDVLVRDLYDNDISPSVLETYPGCDLNPNSPNYVAKKIGDRKVTFNFDATDEAEQRLVISGRFPNVSRRVRAIISPVLDSGVVPKTALPFGFRGVPVIRTTQTLTDTNAALTEGGRTFGAGADVLPRLTCISPVATQITGAIVPPLPYRFKITKGEVDGSSYVGAPGILEIPDSRYYWGVKFEKLVPSGTTSGNNSIMNSNDGTEFNPLILSYSRFQGIQKLDTLVTGADADVFNANKFTLARVALSNETLSDVTGTSDVHMKETAYIRNGVPNTQDYRIADATLNRLTFASLLSGSASTFNKFSDYAKFSTIFYGGFDGVNILDGAASRLGDRATSTEVGGLAQSTAAGLARSGLGYDPNGEKLSNNAVNSYRAAARMMTEKLTVNVNVIAAPGVREPLITDYIARRLPTYALGMYVIDTPGYTDSDVRIFEDSTSLKPNVTKTANSLFSRNLNNNYIAAYFPDVFVNDTTFGRRVKVPASIAALGALAYGDKVSYPWYAPAGFNRAALDFIGNVDVRLSTSDRDYLYENLINPIATFPGNGFVIFGQRTLQTAKSAFDRVNVRRLFLELKRVIIGVARGLIFEPNDATTRKAFVDRATPLLSLIKAQAGVEQFRIICDETNNTQADVEASRLNGRIVVVPTRAIEFIAVDFIITPAGVEFV